MDFYFMQTSRLWLFVIFILVPQNWGITCLSLRLSYLGSRLDDGILYFVATGILLLILNAKFLKVRGVRTWPFEKECKVFEGSINKAFGRE